MIISLFAIRDNQNDYMMPRPYIKDALAIRDFKFWMNDKGGLQYANPGDFDLYEVGTYNTDTAELTPKKIRLIIHGTEVIEHV